MQFAKKSPQKEYPVTYTFGLTDEQLCLSSISTTLKTRGQPELSIQEMALLYQLEPSELHRFMEFAEGSGLTKDQLIDLLHPDEPLVFAPPYEDLKFAMVLSGLSQQEARVAIAEHMRSRPGVTTSTLTIGGGRKKEDRE